MQSMSEKGIICPFRAAKVRFFRQLAMSLADKIPPQRPQRQPKTLILGLFNYSLPPVNTHIHSYQHLFMPARACLTFIPAPPSSRRCGAWRCRSSRRWQRGAARRQRRALHTFARVSAAGLMVSTANLVISPVTAKFWRQNRRGGDRHTRRPTHRPARRHAMPTGGCNDTCRQTRRLQKGAWR